MTEKAYFLNNVSNAEIRITLTTNRVIPAKSSLKLNNKDIVLFKNLKAKRRGKASFLDNLVFSTIPIEKDSRYTKQDEVIAKASEEALREELEARANEAIKEEPELEAYLNGETDVPPEGMTEVSEEEGLAAEAAAMAELEASIVAEAEQTEQPVEQTEETPVEAEQPVEEIPAEQAEQPVEQIEETPVEQTEQAPVEQPAKAPKTNRRAQNK